MKYSMIFKIFYITFALLFSISCFCIEIDYKQNLLNFLVLNSKHNFKKKATDVDSKIIKKYKNHYFLTTTNPNCQIPRTEGAIKNLSSYENAFLSAVRKIEEYTEKTKMKYLSKYLFQTPRDYYKQQLKKIDFDLIKKLKLNYVKKN